PPSVPLKPPLHVLYVSRERRHPTQVHESIEHLEQVHVSRRGNPRSDPFGTQSNVLSHLFRLNAPTKLEIWETVAPGVGGPEWCVTSAVATRAAEFVASRVGDNPANTLDAMVWPDFVHDIVNNNGGTVFSVPGRRIVVDWPSNLLENPLAVSRRPVLTRTNVGSRLRPRGTDVLEISLLDDLLTALRRPDRKECFPLPFDTYIAATLKSALDRPLAFVNPPEALPEFVRPAAIPGGQKWVCKGTTGCEGAMVILPTDSYPVPGPITFPQEVISSHFAATFPAALTSRWYRFNPTMRNPGQGELRCHLVKLRSGVWHNQAVVCTFPTTSNVNTLNTGYWQVLDLGVIG
ncbi:hypothetical protein P7C70_g9635, partial [Phenoliferia sp. Uapishka_3]